MKYLSFIPYPEIRKFIKETSLPERPVWEGKAMYLDKNENPYNIYGQRYPQNRFIEPTHRELREKIADLYSLKPENIFIQHGFLQAADILTKVFLTPTDDFFYLTPVTEELERFLILHKGKKTAVPFGENWPETYLENPPKMAYLMNPSEPFSQNIPKLSKLLTELKEGNFLFIDERYIEFSSEKSLIYEASRKTGLLVLRSFSYAYALAGLSLNFVVAEKELIDLLYLFQEQETVTRIATQYLLEILSAKDSHSAIIQSLKEETRKLYEALKQLPFVKEVLPPEAPFVYVQFENNRTVFEALKQKKILLYQGKDFLRISVGNETENKYLIRILQKLF